MGSKECWIFYFNKKALDYFVKQEKCSNQDPLLELDNKEKCEHLFMIVFSRIWIH